MGGRLAWIGAGFGFGLVVASPCAAQSHATAPRLFFADGTKNAFLLRAIGKAADRKIGFDHHYSIASVACGPGCEGYWLIDRRSGAVIEAPDEGKAGEEMVWDLSARADSDVVKVTYGPMDGGGTRCWSRSYRLNGRAFKPVSARTAVICPK